MPISDKEKLGIREYLLGSTDDDDEIVQIETRLLSEKDFFTSFQICEEELVQDYADGRLNFTEGKLFETNYLISPERHEKLRFARILHDYANRNVPAQENAENVLEKPGFFSRFFAVPYLRPAMLGLSVLLIFGAAFFIWQKFGNDNSDRAINLLNEAYKTSRPFDARVTRLGYAPFSATRGDSGDTKIDKTKLSEAELLLLNKANTVPNAENLHNLGRLYLLKKQFGSAIEELDKARRLNPKEATVLSDLASAYLEDGKLKDDRGEKLLALSRALELYDESLKINPQNPVAVFNKALTLDALNLEQKEREVWDEYLKLDNTSEWAAEAKKRLESATDDAPVSKQSTEIINEYLEAFRRKDEETAYRIVSRNREMITNKLVPQQLVFLYLQNPSANRESLEALKFIASIEQEKSRDSFYSDISAFYDNVPKSELEKLRVATELMKSGYEFCSNGKDDAALAEFEKAKGIYLSAGNRAEAGFCDYWIGYCLTRIGKISESKVLLDSLSEFTQKKNYKWLESQANGWQTYNLLSDNDFTNAISTNEKALKLATETSDLYNLQKSLTQRADLYYQSKNYPEAVKYYGKLLEALSAPEASPRQKWRSYSSIAHLFFAMKMFGVAEAFQKEALNIGIRQDDPSFISSSYKDLGVILGYSGNTEAADEMFAKSREATERFTDSTLKTRIFAELDLHSANIFRLNDKCSEALSFYDNSINFYSQSGFEIELYNAKKGRLLCYYQERKFDSFEPELAQVLQLFREDRTKILDEQNRNTFFDGEQDIYDIAVNYAVEKNDLKTAFNYSEESRTRSLLDLQNSLGKVSNSSQFPEIRFSAESAKPLDITEVQANLPANVQIVQYSVLPDKILLWLIDKNSLSVTDVKVDSSELDEKINNYRKYLAADNAAENESETAVSQELFDLLIKPVEEKLAPEKVICLIPDKAIFQIPLNALISKSDGKFLIEKYALMTSPSASVFVQSSQKAQLLNQNSGNKNSDENILTVGNPAFNKQNHPNLADLPSAATEAQEIAAFYPQSTVLLKENASKQRITQSLEQADIAHFAAHYLVNEKTPLLSGLLTADGNSDDSAGNILASYEIISRPLPKTRMIILSACQSGVEEYYRGEGMIGGARAYLAAGVPVVVASHWSVDSEATTELMTSFHKNRRISRFSSVESLRQAQIQMINSPDTRFRNPYYWSAFNLIGGYSDY